MRKKSNWEVLLIILSIVILNFLSILWLAENSKEKIEKHAEPVVDTLPVVLYSKNSVIVTRNGECVDFRTAGIVWELNK